MKKTVTTPPPPPPSLSCPRHEQIYSYRIGFWSSYFSCSRLVSTLWNEALPPSLASHLPPTHPPTHLLAPHHLSLSETCARTICTNLQKILKHPALEVCERGEKKSIVCFLTTSLTDSESAVCIQRRRSVTSCTICAIGLF